MLPHSQILKLGKEYHVVECLNKIEFLQQYDGGKSPTFLMQHYFLYVCWYSFVHFLADEVRDMATMLMEFPCWADSMVDEI